MIDTASLLRAVICAQNEGQGAKQWVRADHIRSWCTAEEQRGLGARLAALERRGLVESVCGEQSWDLSRRYDVTWRATAEGWSVAGWKP